MQMNFVTPTAFKKKPDFWNLASKKKGGGNLATLTTAGNTWLLVR
jgi:hypothetical protein